jgi:hypothetical protein
MEDEQRIDNLQDEIKLLKGELKNSLASVRDYLLNMELPSSEFSTILAALSGDTTGPKPLSAAAADLTDKPEDMPEPNYDEENPDEADMANELEEPAEDEKPLDVPQENEEVTDTLPDEDTLDDMVGEDELLPEDEEVTEELPEDLELPEDETLEEDIPELDEEELPLEEPLAMEYSRAPEANQGIPKVNMLANLINWVAKAKQDIGYEDLPSFLEVYGVSGHLSPELKDVIIRLAEMSKDLPDNVVDSAVWSQSMLSLHGILTGGDAPLNPVIPSWVDADSTTSSLEDEIIEIDKMKDKTAKLKLVFPTANGESKEFCINLTPEETSDGDGNGNGNGSH